MIKLVLLAFVSSSGLLFAHNNSKADFGRNSFEDSSAYRKKAIAFIEEVEQKDLADSSFILSDKPFSFEYFDCLDEVVSDTGFYTKEELAIIKNKKYPIVKTWRNKFSHDLRLVSSAKVDAIFKNRSQGWEYFYKNIGRSFNTFSNPIFLRTDSYCLFYSDHHCGYLCGGGQLILYKKEKGRWVQVKSYCNWIS